MSSIARPYKIYPNWDFWFENTYTIWQPLSDIRGSLLLKAFWGDLLENQ
jgi:hypothetical protein